MSLRIAHNVEATGIHRSLRVSSDRLAQSMRRLSSGLRINTAADDAAGLGISEKLRGQIRGLDVANRNIQDGIALVSVIEGALNEVHAILHRVRELAVQWNNGTLDFSQKAAIRTEVFALSDEIARIEQSTTYMGISVLTDSSARLTLQVGANAGDIMTISLVDLFGPGVGSLVRPNTFFWLPWLDSDIPGVDFHIDDVAQARVRMGAFSNRLEHALSANQTTQANLMEAESRIRDVDMASEMSTLTRQQLIQTSAQTMLLFANQSPNRVLDLFAM